MRRRLLAAPFAIWGLVALPAGAASLVTNGSFETATINPGGGFLAVLPGDTTSIPGWEVFQDNVHYIGTFWQASDGIRSIDLDGTVGAAGGVRQTFATVPGQTYLVSFDLAGNPLGAPAIKPMRVSADGQSADFQFDVTGRSQAHMGYASKTWSFVADDASATLSFLSLNPANIAGWGAVIDNVAVTAVPEPSALALALGGLVGLALRARARPSR
ncbi:MAG TPA: choice-of-anchor C family protein [Myxococcota bacterium]|nr:choice-of-anchor C family protein [Myxococcota bacterium]